jgi:hypothetical protein
VRRSRPHGLAERGDVAGRRTGVERLGVRAGLREEQRPQHRIGRPADLPPGTVPVQADPGPHGDVGAAERDVRDLKGDGGDVPASEQVAGGCCEQLGTVLVLGQALSEREQRGGVAPEWVARRAEPRRSAIAQREGFPGTADAEFGALQARPARPPAA